MPFRHVLVPVDLSPHSHKLVAFIDSGALGPIGAVTVVHVLRNFVPPAPMIDGPPDFEVMEQYRKDSETAARSGLMSLVSSLTTVAADGELLSSVEGTAQVVCESARAKGCDLMVAGSHRKGGIARLLGGTVDYLLRHSPCPVLVIPSESEDDGS